MAKPASTTTENALPALGFSEPARGVKKLLEIRPGRFLDAQIHHGGEHAATTVFLCHGAGGNKYQWRYQWQALVDAGYRVIAWDFPGHGNSPRPKDRTTYAGRELADDLIALVRRFRTERNYLLAHSYGAHLSLVALPALLEQAPGCINGALLLGAPAPSTPLNSKNRLFSLPAFVLEILRPYLAKGFRQLAWHPAANRSLINFEESCTERNPMRVFKALVNQAIDPELPALLQMRLPIVLLTGDHDGLTPVAGAKALAEQLRQAKLHVIANCGHQIMLEKPEITNRHLFHLLQSPLSLS